MTTSLLLPLLTILVVVVVCFLAPSADAVARKVRKGPQYSLDQENKTSNSNGSRTVMKLNRPKWNQHQKFEKTETPNTNDYQIFTLGNQFFETPSLSNESNVCQREEVETKPGHGKYFYMLSCQRSNSIGKCTRLVSEGNETKITTTYYECCPGYESGPYSDQCNIKISNKNLREALIDGGRGEFVTAFDTFNLTSAHLTNDQQQSTVFAPTNESLNAFKAGLEKSDEIENYVEITPDLVETARHIRGRLVSHVVPKLVNHVPFTSTRKIRTAHHDGSIFLRRHFPRQKDEYGMTANCIPVTSSERVSNGLIYNVDGFLQSSELGLEELLETRDDVKTFLSLLRKANLSIFGGNETFHTFLVPTDAAFERDPSLLARIRHLPDKCLKELILSHIFHEFNCLSRTSEMENLLEIREQVQHEGSDDDNDAETFKVGQAKVVEKDVITDDGVVHFIDSVLLPPAILSAPELTKVAGATKFSEMLQGLEFEPSDDVSFSLIVPTNQALEEYNKKNNNNNNKMSTSQLVDFHTIPGISNFLDKSSAQTAFENKTILIRVQRIGFSLRLLAQCTPLHINRRYHKTCSFTTFFTNKVLEPARGNLFDLIQADDNLSKFLSLVESSGLEELFKSDEGLVTVFALPNEEFEKLSADTKEKLSTDKEFTKQFVLSHVYDNLHCLSEGMLYIRNKAGRLVHFSNSRIGSNPVLAEGSNRMATNGVLHLIKEPVRHQPLFALRFGSSFDPWAPFMRLCWSNDDDEVCEEFKKK